MLPLRIAARFVRSSLGQSALIVGGIAVGIAVQVFVGSLITSLQADLLNRTVGSAPHVTIESRTQGDTVAYTDRVRRVIASTPGVTAVAPVRTFSALFTKDTENAPLVVTGGTAKQLSGIYHLDKRMVEGKLRLGQGDILIGKGFSNRYRVYVGDPLTITLAQGRTADFTVAGVFDLGQETANERVAFVSDASGQNAIGASSNDYSQILVQVRDVFASADIAEGWRKQLPRLRITDWQAQNAELLTGLQSQSASSYMIQAFVLIAVALGIASTLAVSAVQKTRQIGILKALGMTDRRTGLIFLWQGGLLGILGTVLGIVFGLALIGAFALAGASGKGPLFPIRPQPAFILLSAAVGILVSLASAALPYRRTARLDAIEVIQNG